MPSQRPLSSSPVRRLWVAAALGLALSALAAQGQTLSVGNLIYLDQNGNRTADAGEGVADVTVQLFEDGDVPGENSPVASTVTASDGRYLFSGVDVGTYFIHVPFNEFTPGGDLEGTLNLPGTEGLDADDDLGEDGLEEEGIPTVDGVSSDIVDLDEDAAPVFDNGETGFEAAADDGDDANTDLTLDLGFYRPVGVGNLVFIDANGNGVADANEGVESLVVQLFRAGFNPEFDDPEMETTTDSDGRFLFSDLPPGDYFLFIPPLYFTAGEALVGLSPIAGTSPLADDDAGEDSLAAANPDLTGVRSETFSLARGVSPTAFTGETGSSSSSDDGADDANIDLTRDLGFSAPLGKVGVGNLVFVDDNANGVADAGEGVEGVWVELFQAADDPQTAAPLVSMQTSADGHFLFNNLNPGSYVLHVPASQFGLDGPLYAATSLTGQDVGTLDDDAAEDGRDDQVPTTSGVSSAVIVLALGTAPTAANTETGLGASSDNLFDGDVDLTRDFGFNRGSFDPVGVGNTVFFDANTNQQMDEGEGVDGVTLQLFPENADPLTAVPLATRLSQSGSYYFEGLQNGRYFIHIPASEFQQGGPLEGKLSSTGNGVDDGTDDDLDENGIDSVDPAATGISSVVFDLTADTEPDDSEEGFEGDYDDLDDDNFDLTIDFGFQIDCPQMVVGPALLAEANQGEFYSVQFVVNGGEPGFSFEWFTESDFPEGLTMASNGILSGTPTVTGPYEFEVRATAPDGCVAQVTRILTIEPPARPVGVGNLVFVDADFDGRYDAGEGAEGVTLQLFSEGADPSIDTPLMNTTSDVLGKYAFTGLQGGRYFVHIPASEFQPTAALEAMTSAPGAGEDNGLDDDVGEDGIDAYRPDLTGVSSIEFTLNDGTEPIDSPTGQVAEGFETGFGGEDDVNDADHDQTIDLGFIPLPPGGVGVGNLVFWDANRNGFADSDEGVDGVTVRLFLDGANPQLDTPIASQLTSGGGFYLFTGLPQGRYFLHIPASDFAVDGPLRNRISLAGVGNLVVKRDDEEDENGLDEADPTVGGIVSAAFDLYAYEQPTNALGEFGQGATMDDSEDEHVDLTQDLGFDIFCPPMTVLPASLPQADQRVAYATTLTASGGTGPYTWSSEDLPLWLGLSSDGVLSGTPPDAGSFPFSVRATDAEGCRIDVERTLVVIAEPVGTLGVGNLVFVDQNENGIHDLGEGVDGVAVQLFSGDATPGSTPPLATRITTSGGQYLFDQLFAGEYFVRISPEMFAPGAPLAFTDSLPGSGSNQDDDISEDGLDPVDITATGVRSATFTLSEGGAPTAASYESGAFSNSDDGRDADIDLSQDFGFVSLASGSFLDWQAENALGGLNGAFDNPDGDFETNLMEYAIGDDAQSGVRSGKAFHLRINAEDDVQALFTRPLPFRPDINYRLEATTDAPGPGASWGLLTPADPLVVPVTGGEQLIYSALQDLLFFAGRSQGYLRLRIDLDANQDQIPEEITYSPAWGFNLNTLEVRNQTFSMPLAREALFSGAVDSNSGASVDITTAAGAEDFRTQMQGAQQYFIEVLSGSEVGHRWDVDEGACTATSIALDLASAANSRDTGPGDLSDAVIALRPHWKVKDLFDPARLQAGPDDRSSAKVTFFDPVGGSFQPLWLFANGSNPIWFYLGDTSFTDAGERLFLVGDGCFVMPGASSSLQPLSGMVREHQTALPLASGVSLVGGPWTGARSPADLAISLANGFTGAAEPTLADRIRTWNGDVGADESYTSYFLLEAPEIERWVLQGDASLTDQSHQPLFQPYRAVFITSGTGAAHFVVPFAPDDT